MVARGRRTLLRVGEFETNQLSYCRCGGGGGGYAKVNCVHKTAHYNIEITLQGGGGGAQVAILYKSELEM